MKKTDRGLDSFDAHVHQLEDKTLCLTTSDGQVLATSSTNLVAIESLLRWDTFEQSTARKHAFGDNNPYVPSAAYSIGEGLPSRYRGRFSTCSPIPPRGRSLMESDESGFRTASDAIGVAKVNPRKKKATKQTKEAAKKSKIDKAESAGIIEMITRRQPRPVNEALLSEKVCAARRRLQHSVQHTKRSGREHPYPLPNAVTSRKDSMRSSSEGSRDHILPPRRSSSHRKAHLLSFMFGVESTDDMAQSLAEQVESSTAFDRSSSRQGSTYAPLTVPAIEVFFEGDEQPTLVLRHRIHPLDSVATVRRVINEELRKLVGGSTITEESNWTFVDFHPMVIRWLEKLHFDFLHFYNDTEHLRYTGQQAKDVRLATLRHREQGALLGKYIRNIRHTLEHNGSVMQLFRETSIHKRVFEKFGGMPPSSFFPSGSVPILRAKIPRPDGRDMRHTINPVIGAIKAQLQRMEAFVTNGSKLPPPTDCDLPSYKESMKRIGYRLRASKIRREAIQEYDEAVYNDTLIESCTHGDYIALAVPRITLKKLLATPQWEVTEIMMTQCMELCREGRGDASEPEDVELDPSDFAGVLQLTSASLTIPSALESPSRRRSSVSPAGSNSPSQRSPTRRGSQSPTGRSPPNQPSPKSSNGNIYESMPPHEELSRMVADGVVPLHMRDSLGFSLLDYCVWHRRPKLVKVLLDAGIPLTYQDHFSGNTCLHRLIDQRVKTVKDLQCLRLILTESKPEHLATALATRNKRGETPLIMAVAVLHFPIVQALFAANERCVSAIAYDVRREPFPSEDEQSLLDAKYSLDAFVDACFLDGVQWAVSNTSGSMESVGDVFCSSLLHRAVVAPPFLMENERCRDEVIAWALRRCDPLKRDYYGRTAFHYAAQSRCTRWLVPFVEGTFQRTGSILVQSAHKKSMVAIPTSTAGATVINSTGKHIAQCEDAAGNTILHTLLMKCPDDVLVETDGLLYISHANVSPYLSYYQLNCDGNSTLHLAMQRRLPQVTQVLCRNLKFESAANIHKLFSTVNKDGDTIVGCAIKAQFADGIRFLFENSVVAECCLLSLNSRGRSPLLLAVDVLVAKAYIGEEGVTLEQRPNCNERRDRDVMNVLIHSAESHGIASKVLNAVSGPLGDTALHAAVRAMLWHPSALLLSSGALANIRNLEGKTALQLALSHQHDVSVARLLVANDQTDRSSGDTFFDAIVMRGAACSNPNFVDEMFIKRHPYNWESAEFSRRFLVAAAQAGNVMVLERLVTLGARFEPSASTTSESPLGIVLEKFLVALRLNARKKWSALFTLHESYETPIALRDRVQTLLIAMVQREFSIPPESLFLAVACGMKGLVDALVQTADRDALMAYNDPVKNRHVLCALAGCIDYFDWPPALRVAIIRESASALLKEAEVSSTCRRWYWQAVGSMLSLNNVEGLCMLVFCGASNYHCRESSSTSMFLMAFPRFARRLAVRYQGQDTSICWWLVRRLELDPAVIVALALAEGLIDVVETLLHYSPANQMLRMLTMPIPSWSSPRERDAILQVVHSRFSELAAVYQSVWHSRRVLGVACQSRFVLSTLTYDDSGKQAASLQSISLTLHWLIQQLLVQKEGTSDRECAMLAIREAFHASILSDRRDVRDVIALQVTHSLPENEVQFVIGALPASTDASHGRWRFRTAAACYLASPFKYSGDVVNFLPMLLSHDVHVEHIDERVIDAFFIALRVAQREAAMSNTSSDVRQVWDDVLQAVVRWTPAHVISTPLTPHSTHSVSRDASVSSPASLAGTAPPSTKNAGPTRFDEGFPLDNFVRTTFGQAMEPRHIFAILEMELINSLSVVITTVSRFPQLNRVLSLIQCPKDGSMLLTALLHRKSVPDAVVLYTVDACRSEAAEWRNHCWWLEHVLDVYHPTNVKRVPQSTRHQYPTLSFMRDISRSDPCSRKANSDKHCATPLHYAARFERQAAVVRMLETQQRELDVNIVDNFGRTPLITACRFGRMAIASQLVSTGVDLLMEDQRGLSALHHASTSAIIELVLADEDGPEAATSRSSKSHRLTPLMSQIAAGRWDCAALLLSHTACDNCDWEQMVNSDTGETLVHVIAGAGAQIPRGNEVLEEKACAVLQTVLERLSLKSLTALSAQGWTARDYSRPRSKIESLLIAKAPMLQRNIRLFPEGKYSTGTRDSRLLRNAALQLTGVSLGDAKAAGTMLRLHARDSEVQGPMAISVDELAWDYARTRRDADLLRLLEKGQHDMQRVRIYGIPPPRSENDKRTIAKEINTMLQTRFGGCKGGCQIIIPVDKHDEVTNGSLSVSKQATPSMMYSTTNSNPAALLASSLPYAAAHMNDEERIPQLMAAANLSVKNRPLTVVREPHQGPTYRIHPLPGQTNLLHLICKNGLIQSLNFILRNNYYQGSPSRLLIQLLGGVFDESGLSPLHLAILSKQWTLLIELLRDRISFQPGRELPLTPAQVFPSPLALLTLYWSNNCNTPADSSSLMFALAAIDKSLPLTQSEQRFSLLDAQPAAYALMRLSAGPAITLRMQRVVLATILETEFPSHLATLRQTLAGLFTSQVARSRVSTVAAGAAYIDAVAKKVSTHLLTGMELLFDLEGADARDSSAERERTKAFFMFHVRSGVIPRMMQKLLSDVFLDNKDVGLFGWVCALRLRRVTLQCPRKVTDEPKVFLEALDNNGSVALTFTVGVDHNNALVMGEPWKLLTEYFCLPLLHEARALGLRVLKFPSHAISIASEVMSAARHVIEAIEGGRLLSDLADMHQRNDDGELLPAADSLWNGLRKLLVPTTIITNASITSSNSSSATEIVPPLLDGVRMMFYAQRMRDVAYFMDQYVHAAMVWRDRDSGVNELHVGMARRFCLASQSTAVTFLFTFDDEVESIEDEVTKQVVAKAVNFDGLELLRRNWSDLPMNGARRRSTVRFQPVGSGLQLLLDSKVQVESEVHVVVSCPLQSRGANALQKATIHPPSLAAVEVFRGSQWEGWRLKKFRWSSSQRQCFAFQSWDARAQLPREYPSSAQQRPDSVMSLRDIDVSPLGNHSDVGTGEKWTPITGLDNASLAGVVQKACEVQDLLRKQCAASARRADRRSLSSRESTLLRLVFPFLLSDITFFFSSLRLVSRSWNEGVEHLLFSLSATELTTQVERLCNRASEATRKLQRLRTCVTHEHRRIPVGLRDCLFHVLCGPYFTHHPRVHGGASTLISRGVAVELHVAAFCSNPCLVFQMAASLFGINEAVRRVIDAVPAGKRGTYGSFVSSTVKDTFRLVYQLQSVALALHRAKMKLLQSSEHATAPSPGMIERNARGS